MRPKFQRPPLGVGLRLAGVLALASCTVASNRRDGSAEAVQLTIQDLTPQFLVFYERATHPPASEANRWALWQELYGFAAVPPTPEGEALARRLLNDAWPKYPAALERIRRGASGVQPAPERVLRDVVTLLAANVPVRTTVRIFVGGFEGNAFTAMGRDNIPAVSVPIESAGLDLRMAHEFTHVVQAKQAGLSLDWQRSIAHTIFCEGLAMRAARQLNPGRPDEDYLIDSDPKWAVEAAAHRAAILEDLKAHLTESDSAAVMKYTMGRGGAGVDREAYFGGWVVVGDLLDRGWTFPRLARVTDDEMTALVGESLARLANTP